MKIIKWLRGKKTYVTAIVIGLSAGLQALGHDTPPWIFELLAGLGLITLRAGVAKAAASPPR